MPAITGTRGIKYLSNRFQVLRTASPLFPLDLFASHPPKSALNPTNGPASTTDKQTAFSVTSKHSTPREKQRGRHSQQAPRLEPVCPRGISAATKQNATHCVLLHAEPSPTPRSPLPASHSAPGCNSRPTGHSANEKHSNRSLCFTCKSYLR